MRELIFDVDDPNLGFLLTLTIRAQRRRLVCGVVSVRQRDGGSPVTGSVLRRLPLEAYVNLVRRNLLAASVGWSPLLMQEVGGTAGSVAFEPATIEAVRQQEAAQRRRVPLSEVLPEVAKTYREALADPDDHYAPTAAVGRRLHYSRGHAARLVSEARRAGLLRDARPGVGGEIEPGEEETS